MLNTGAIYPYHTCFSCMLLLHNVTQLQDDIQVALAVQSKQIVKQHNVQERVTKWFPFFQPVLVICRVKRSIYKRSRFKTLSSFVNSRLCFNSINVFDLF